MKNIIKNIYLRLFIVGFFLFISIMVIGSTVLYTQNKDFPFNIQGLVGDSYSKDIIVVQIDDYSLNKLSFPLPRNTYIDFIKNLKEAGASVVGFDIFFADKGNNKVDDIKLANTIKEAGNIVLGSDIKDDIQLIQPYKLFDKGVLDTGYFQPIVDSNNKVYAIEPFRVFKGGRIEDSFSFSILRNYFKKTGNYNNSFDPKVENGVYNFFGREVPITKGIYNNRPINIFDISFVKSEKFLSESFYNIYKGNFNKDLFKNKIVLVGYTAEGVKDEFTVPKLGTIKGVYIHASVISNVLENKFIVYFNENYEKIFYYFLILFILYFAIFFGKGLSYWIEILIAFSIFVFITGIYIYLYVQYVKEGYFLYPNYPISFILIIIFSFFTSYILKYIIEDSNKVKLSKALGEYVSKDIVNEILNGDGNINLEGERKRISIFFSDIAGFTTISEKLSPEELVGFLRVYLGDMSKIIIDNRGFVNKYEGDAIMALWGVFTKHHVKNTYDACYSALKQQDALALLNEKWKSEGNETSFSVRMGIHTGDAIVGNIGAVGMKMEFTALGDSVNLGSRLEGVNKVYGTNICISEDTMNDVKDKFEFRYLDKIRVKGKSISINIYELLSLKGELGDYKKDIVIKFSKALKLYLDRDFKSALEIFIELASLGDSPSKTYISRCELYMRQVPDDNWDGVWTMTEK